MKLAVIFLIVFVSCESSQQKRNDEKNRNIMAETIRDVMNKKYNPMYSEILKYSQFINPDTSLSNIVFKDSISSDQIINESDQIDENQQYYFYSKMKKEIVSLTQQIGDGKYLISIFKVDSNNKIDQGYRTLDITTFETEKGIKLGISKKKVIDKIGSFYVAKDSSENGIELYYRIEKPNDSKTKILEHYNMPTYYASYKFYNDKLTSFEFGFEYP